jgi:hypothetical protein
MAHACFHDTSQRKPVAIHPSKRKNKQLAKHYYSIKERSANYVHSLGSCSLGREIIFKIVEIVQSQWLDIQ